MLTTGISLQHEGCPRLHSAQQISVSACQPASLISPAPICCRRGGAGAAQRSHGISKYSGKFRSRQTQPAQASSFSAPEGRGFHTPSAVVPAPSTPPRRTESSSLAHPNSLSPALPPLSSGMPPYLKATGTPLSAWTGCLVPAHAGTPKVTSQGGTLCRTSLHYALGFTPGNLFIPGPQLRC